MSSRDHKRTTVRFTDAEFDRLQEEAKLSGLSLPALLKKSHFGKNKLQLLFGEVERHLVCKELRAIGNNINQVTHAIHICNRKDITSNILSTIQKDSFKLFADTLDF